MFVKLIVVFCYVTTSLTQMKNPKDFEVEEVKYGEYPFVVALLEIYVDDNNTEGIFGFCTGSLITEQWTLTAAHCIEKRLVEELYVWYNNFSISPLETKLYSKVLKKVVHPVYSSRKFSLDYDISLLLVHDINLSSYGVLSLKDPSVMIGRSVVYVGGSRINDSGNSTMKLLRYGESEVIECDVAIKSTLKYVLCVITDSFKSYEPICYGDSGGPSFYEGRIVGLCAFNIVSNKTVSVFTAVTPFKDWMLDVMHTIHIKFEQPTTQITTISDDLKELRDILNASLYLQSKW